VRRSVLTVLALLGLGLAVPTPGAQADATRDVGLKGFADLVVDQGHGHVFISQGRGTIVVTDLAGRKVGALTGLPGADGMTLSDDGSELYVAVTGAAEIAQVSTADPFAEGAVTTFSTGAGTCPLDVAFTGGRVWYAATCDGQWANLHALDPATGTITDTLNQVYNPRLASNPAVPDTFFAGDRGSSPAQFYKFTVTEGTEPTLTETSDFDVAGSSLGFTHHREFSTADLSRLRGYPVPRSRNAVAVRASDDLSAFASTNGVVLYRHGAATSLGTYRFDDPDAFVVDGGLAFGTSKLYAVTHDADFAPHYALQVITPRNRPRAHVSVAVAGGPLRYGKKATVTATLRGHKSRSHLELFEVTADGKVHFLKSGRPDRHGRLTVRPFMTTNATFIGVFDGDAKVAANGAAKRVKVQAFVLGKLFKAQRHVGHVALYKPSQKLLYGAAVGPNKKGQCVNFRAQFRIGGHWGHDGTTGCVALNRKSVAGASIQGSNALAGIPIRIRAEWSGDSANTRANAAWSYAKFTGAARGASKVAYGTLRATPVSPSAVVPKIRAPFSQQTARSQSSPSSSPVNPISWVS
jgi:hypothetical protein